MQLLDWLSTIATKLTKVFQFSGKGCTAGLLALSILIPATASANEQERLVRQAELVVEAFLEDETHQGMRVYVQNAFGVLVVPDLLRAGFFIGAEYGRGVLLVRDLNTGEWSNPAFYDLYGGNLGIQFGGKASDVVFTIMNREAIDQLLANRIKLGTDASVALGPMGAGVGAGTTAQFGEDFYFFARSKGLYGGLSLDGSMVFAKPEWNNAYYGTEVRAVDILLNKVASNPNSNGLREALGMF